MTPLIRCSYGELALISELKPHPKNRNKHPDKQIKRYAEILAYSGVRKPIRVSSRSGFITAGHGALLAAKINGWTKYPVDIQSYESDEQEYADLNADNALALQAELDIEAIKLDIKEMPKLQINMLGIKGLEKVVEHTRSPADGEDDVPDSVESRVKRGDIWQLGNHRLICGSSTDADTVEALTAGNRADITFTSPPYNVGRTPNGNEQKYENDSDDKEQDVFADFLIKFTQNALNHSDFVFVNIQSLAGNKVALIDWLWTFRRNFADTMIWDKAHTEPAMAKNVLNSQFEYVHIFSHTAKRVIGKKEFRGTLPNIFQLNGRIGGKEYSKIHKATFPVAFAEHFVFNFTEEGGSVFEPFAGTGTTAIACEKLNRKCFMVELDPKYCDVILTRWEQFTGLKADLITELALD